MADAVSVSHLTLQVKDIISIAAILFSPIIAVLVAKYLQNRKSKKDHKLYIFSTLMAARHSPINDEVVRALNMVDVAFCNDEKVRKLWHEYYDMLNNEGLNNPVGYKARQ
ncbi:MAG: DUF6680 family protein, partial [Nitrospirota bacterium]